MKSFTGGLRLSLSFLLCTHLASAALGASDLLSVDWGPSILPTNLEDFVGFAETADYGLNYGLVINADGKVTGWGVGGEGVLDVPAGLSNVVAVAVGKGPGFSIALKGDGTVGSWGRREGTLPPPADLTNVIALAVGGYHALALRRDGHVSGWLTFNADFGQ